MQTLIYVRISVLFLVKSAHQYHIYYILVNIMQHFKLVLISMYLYNAFFCHNNEYVTWKNKRPMGHIAHLRKQFKSINTYDNIITLIKRRKKTHYYLYEN